MNDGKPAAEFILPRAAIYPECPAVCVISSLAKGRVVGVVTWIDPGPGRGVLAGMLVPGSGSQGLAPASRSGGFARL